MVLVHKVFRRELRLLGGLIADVTAGNVTRAALLGSHYRELTKALVHHHSAERDLLWRRLRELAPLYRMGGMDQYAREMRAVRGSLTPTVAPPGRSVAPPRR